MKRLRAYPVQVVNCADAAIVIRGRMQFKISGARAIELIERLFARLSGRACTLGDLLNSFGESDHAAVQRLVSDLLTRRILSYAEAEEPDPPDEDTLDVFYWHFGASRNEIAKGLGELALAVVGVNKLSHHLAGLLSGAGFKSVELVDDLVLRDNELFDGTGALIRQNWGLAEPVSDARWRDRPPVPHCVIATSDQGNGPALRGWNEFCNERKICFLPVMLHELLGYVGPFTIPGETACYECLSSRQQANAAEPEISLAVEQARAEGQAISGVHPLMVRLVADVAAMELFKFYAQIPRSRVGSVIEISPLGGTMTPRKVLRAPRCRVCSGLNRQPATAIEPSFRPRVREII